MHVARATGRTGLALAVISASLWIILSCDDSDPPTDSGDVTPPAAVVDLAAGEPTGESLTLTWTAVGDDCLDGTAAHYDIRYTADSLASWDDMTSTEGPAQPRPSGERESFEVQGLDSSKLYYLRIKTADEASNWSDASNQASGATSAYHPVDEMVWVPDGWVRMDTDLDRQCCGYNVYTKGYWIDVYEVTNGRYKEFLDADGYDNAAWWNPVGWAWRVEFGITQPGHWNSEEFHGGGLAGNERFPVTSVSWWEADAFCRWSGKRLPTEAEWERAAKGGCECWSNPDVCDRGDTPRYPWGDELTSRMANYGDSGDPFEGDGMTAPVGFYDGYTRRGFRTIDSPSPYGLYDVAGNISEWCSTRWDDPPYDPDDGREEPPPDHHETPGRVVRGGSWNDRPSFGRNFLCCAERDHAYPDLRFELIGFRCVRNR